MVATTLAVVASGLTLTSVASTPMAGADPVPPSVVGEPCAPGEGVTVVVDFQDIGSQGTEIGCAPGQQTDGFAALTNAGFTYNDDGGPVSGSTCQIRSQPATGYPGCWYDGFWGYWKSNGSTPWAWSQVGAGNGPLPIDSIEGWSWTSPIPVDYAGKPMRVSVEDLGDYVLGAADCATGPEVPTFDIVDDDEVLPVTIADGYPVEVAVLADPAADPASATWTTAEAVDLSSYDGTIRVLARRVGAECPSSPTFDSTYDVRATYAPRWNAAPTADGSPSPAIDKAEPRFVGFITGHSEYTPGGNVNTSFQVPTNAYGPIDSSLVVLGDRGSYTATFDAPITDGDGYDFAAFENGFSSGANDFLEVAYVEVSSNGTDFVRFDSASRRTTPVASFGLQNPAELGGLPGKDVSGKGTPFDLRLLQNKAAVRDGIVDLNRITHVRLKDIQGDGNDLDSFGRPIYDPNPVTGSAGYDLTGIGVLNALDEIAPAVDITSAPTGTVFETSATVAFTVDDATATVEYSLDGSSFAAAASPLELTDVAPGGHEVTVRATDAAGNAGSDAAAWTIAVPNTEDRAWAAAAYADLLGRSPSDAELDTVIARIGAGATRRTIARELANGDEWLQHIVTRFYEDTLDRTPDAGGLQYWSAQVRSGRQTVAWVAAQFYASAEYYATLGGGTAPSWITDLYAKLLHRQPDAAGLDYWVGRISAVGRVRVAAAMYASPESRGDRVVAVYRDLLDRDPDAAGQAYWANRVASEGDIALAVHLVTSGEYLQRAIIRFP